MTGRITRLIDVQQSGTIAGDDGVEYVFKESALIDVTFSGLQLGTLMTFTPTLATQRAAAVRLAKVDIERLR